MKQEKQPERQKKIPAGLESAYERMLEFKRQRNSVVMVARQGEIARIQP